MKYTLKISTRADQDLIDIYLYGATVFGIVQAEAYYDELKEHLYDLCDFPFAYVRAYDIKYDYRKSVFKSHSVYYRIADDTVEIMAVIGRQDIELVL